jgi:putative ABC transport system substrate-binding protein
MQVDVIVTSGTQGGMAAKNATSTIPIVMASGGDFVADGLVASFARPGGKHHGRLRIRPGAQWKTSGAPQRDDIGFPDGVEQAFAGAARLRVGAVVIISDGATIVHRAQLGSAALHHRMPTIFANKAYLEGRILKGAKPADMPIERPTKFELVISLKTARTLGLTIPRSLLLRADQVIE